MIKESMRFLFKNNTQDRIQSLLESISEQQEDIKKLKKDYDVLNDKYIDYYYMLHNLTEDMNISVWRKNTDHKYTIANPTHCKQFFNIPDTPQCLKYVRGKTDKQLLDEIYSNNGFVNNFGEICTLSDDYTIETGQTVHLLESSILDGDQKLLYIIKMPQYNSRGGIIGTNGIA